VSLLTKYPLGGPSKDLDEQTMEDDEYHVVVRGFNQEVGGMDVRVCVSECACVCVCVRVRCVCARMCGYTCPCVSVCERVWACACARVFTLLFTRVCEWYTSACGCVSAVCLCGCVWWQVD
jgi:hypothetical protein